MAPQAISAVFEWRNTACYRAAIVLSSSYSRSDYNYISCYSEPTVLVQSTPWLASYDTNSRDSYSVSYELELFEPYNCIQLASGPLRSLQSPLR